MHKTIVMLLIGAVEFVYCMNEICAYWLNHEYSDGVYCQQRNVWYSEYWNEAYEKNVIIG